MASSFGSYAHYATSGQKNVCLGPCSLLAISINGGTAGAVTVYDDNAAKVNTFAVIETIGATNPTVLRYYANMSRGITLDLAANTDVTVIYQ